MAVLAGFVFIGLVYLLTEGRRRHNGETFMLFLASFICLAAGSYIETVVSGEVACSRAWSQSMISSGLVAVGAVAMLAALAWLLPPQYGTNSAVRGFTFACVLLVAVIVAELLTTAGRGFLLDAPGWRHWRDAVTWYLPIVVILLAGAFAVRHVGVRGPDTALIARKQQRRAGIAAASVIAFTLVNLAALGPIGDRPADQWQRLPSWVVAVSVLVPLVGAAVVLVTLMWALPTSRTWQESAAVRHEDGTNGQGPGRGTGEAEAGPTRAVGADASTPRPEVGGVVDMARLRERLETYLVNHYVGLHVTVVSVALGIAGLTAAGLVAARGQIPTDYHLLLGFLWLASFFATVAAFAGAVVGSFALPGQIPAMWDLVLPLLLAVAEFLLFAALAPPIIDLGTGSIQTERTLSTAVGFWFYCLAGFGAVAAAHISRAWILFRNDAAFDPGLRKAIRKYRSRLLFPDTVGAGVCAILGLVAGTVTFGAPNAPMWLTYAFATGAVVLLVGAVASHGRTARHWRHIKLAD